MKKYTFYVDMDDTLCDFAGQHYIDIKLNPLIQYPQATYGFFTKLKPLPDAIESMHELVAMGHDVWILSRPSVLNPMCYTEKRVWVENHLGLDFANRLILCTDKGRVGTENDFLIDDFDWINLKEPKEGEIKLTPWKGTQLRFGSPEFKNWKLIMEHIKNNH